jgi:dihydrodiol dehydrogenase / D-xylose 1-dehydrogenase (NADP)
MSENKFTCRWACLGLTAIAENFIADLLLERPEDDPIGHELVAVSTTDLKERATAWLIDHEVPNASKVALYTEEMLAKGAFDIVYVPTPHPLHFYMCGSLSRIRGVSWWKASNNE